MTKHGKQMSMVAKTPVIETKELAPDAKEFLMKEYDALRKQIDDLTRELLSIEKWCLIVSGVIWSWLASTQNKSMPELIYWCPAIISCLFGLRVLGLHRSTLLAGKYITGLEKTLCLPKGFGWESYLTSKRPLLIAIPAYLYWVLLIGVNVAIPLWYVR